VRAFTEMVLLATAAGVLLAVGIATAAPFPDVPPWHWAYDAVTRIHDAGLVQGYPSSPTELIETSITQVYDGFAHAAAPGAQEWVERFTYDRSAAWPAPFRRGEVAAFLLTGIRPTVNGDTAVATFHASVTLRGGSEQSASMRVALRFNGDDWQVDYATLAQASPLFR